MTSWQLSNPTTLLLNARLFGGGGVESNRIQHYYRTCTRHNNKLKKLQRECENCTCMQLVALQHVPPLSSFAFFAHSLCCTFVHTQVCHFSNSHSKCILRAITFNQQCHIYEHVYTKKVYSLFFECVKLFKQHIFFLIGQL